MRHCVLKLKLSNSALPKAQALKEMASDAEVKKFVAANANAVGYIDKGAVDGSVKAVLTP